MATLHHLLAFSSIPSRKPFFASPIPLSGHRYCQRRCRCSRIAAASSNKPRQDLANVVRRRGYKLLGQLLEAAPAAKFNASLSDPGPVSSEDQDNLKFLGDDTHGGPKLNEEDASTLESKSLSMEGDSGSVTEHTDETKFNSGSEDANEEWTSSNWNLDSEAQNTKIEAERKHLESLMHQTESEMKRLNQLIANEELSLSILKIKTEKEIVNMLGILSEADIGLRAIERSLSGLKAVEVEYSGDGVIVELAGSFNGWHQPFQMDSVPSSSMAKFLNSPKKWATVLWLYPGVYQMKFIVDGRWTVDGRRETIFQGFTQNNVLRV